MRLEEDEGALGRVDDECVSFGGILFALVLVDALAFGRRFNA